MKVFFAGINAFLIGVACVNAQTESGFVSLFDGKTLEGWTLVGRTGSGYGVTNGAICCATGESGNLFTGKDYADFVLRFEFKLTPGANNGVGIRAPFDGDSAYMGMEIQVLDDSAPRYATLQPWQFHGSIYNIAPAKRGSLKPVGEWNDEEISAIGRHIKVVVNGKTIVDANLNGVTDAETLRKHPGMFRERGHIGFLGHGDYIEFRNIRIRELPVQDKDNTPPDGFVALFNGNTMDGWKGLFEAPYDNPAKRSGLSRDELEKLQAKADQRMREHWTAADGGIVFDGHGDSLCTKKDYGDFEMLVDWKIPPHGDSGIYLRGSPQVQIWDPLTQPTRLGSEVGSGGLYNNKKNPANPLKVADRPIGEWNRFRIIMVGERVHVFLNGELVTRDTVLENYWERDKPVYPSGDIQLQNHGGLLWFKNIYIRELPGK